MKKLAIFLLVCTLGLSSFAYAADTSLYNDIKTTNWVYDAVKSMSDKGIIKGYSDGSFQPNGILTYGEFIKMAVIASGTPDPGNAAKPKNWAENYYDKAIELKYFSDMDINVGQLNMEIPRQDMALIISAILGDVKIDNYSKIQAQIADVNAETKNDYDIVKSYASGILTGYTDNTFQPTATLKRSESAAVMQRLVDPSKRKLPGTGTTTPTDIPKSGTDIGAVIENYKTFEQVDIDAGFGSVLADAERYELIDPAGYNVEAVENNGAKGIKINGDWPLVLGWGNLYLMKDNKIVEFTNNGSYHEDITTIEYFVFPKASEKLIRIMPNPLYKGN